MVYRQRLVRRFEQPSPVQSDFSKINKFSILRIGLQEIKNAEEDARQRGLVAIIPKREVFRQAMAEFGIPVRLRESDESLESVIGQEAG